MQKKQQVLLFITLIIILLTSILTSFAYFSGIITGEEVSTSITVTGGSMNIVYNGAEDIIANAIVPDNKPFAIK